MIRTGGGAFDPNERHVYFLAGSLINAALAAPVHPYLLIAINEIVGPYEAKLDRILDQGVKLFIDSGIFNLASEHARRHKVTISEAIALPAEALDGFEKLWSRYLEIVERYQDRVWGYVELDAGGRDGKTTTRGKLEALGLRPIPVYHPLSDGWDYFETLATQYDRICVGNMVGANAYERARLIATIWERSRAYPDLWVHLLGYTPDEHLNAWPVASVDSSTWLAGLRWNAVNVSCDGRSFSRLEQNMRYIIGDNANVVAADGDATLRKATTLCAYDAAVDQANWRHHLDAWQRIGCALSPAPL